MKIDADDNNGRGSRLLIRHMEHAPFIRHSPAIQTISAFYVFYSFTAERGATIMIALPINRQTRGSTAVMNLRFPWRLLA